MICYVFFARNVKFLICGNKFWLVVLCNVVSMNGNGGTGTTTWDAFPIASVLCNEYRFKSWWKKFVIWWVLPMWFHSFQVIFAHHRAYFYFFSFHFISFLTISIYWSIDIGVQRMHLYCWEYISVLYNINNVENCFFSIRKNNFAYSYYY